MSYGYLAPKWYKDLISGARNSPLILSDIIKANIHITIWTRVIINIKDFGWNVGQQLNFKKSQKDSSRGFLPDS